MKVCAIAVGGSQALCGAHLTFRSASADVDLHVDGHERNGLLSRLAADQEVIVYQRRGKETLTDRRSLTAVTIPRHA